MVFGGFRRKTAYSLTITILLIGVLISTVKIEPVRASGTIYIRADGSIEPPTAPIQRSGDIYTFTDNIYDSIVVEKDDIILDGAGYMIQGNGSGTGIRVYGDYMAAKPRINVTIKNVIIENFDLGIDVYYSIDIRIVRNNIKNNWNGITLIQFSNYCSIAENNITANDYSGINLLSCSYNSIIENNIRVNGLYGIRLFESSDNVIYHNNFIDNSYQTYVYTPGYANVWDNGYPFGGNWWSWWGKNTDIDI
ncbi:MAG: NosD domain-containing protein [Candidatus Bathyarchaeia archaeon]